MSLHLELGPKKLSIKTPPGRLLSEVLAEFCTKYDMKPEEYGLQHNKKNLDLSLTFRLSGLPQNCKLDVIRRAKPAGGSNGSVTIGLQVPSGERWVASFPTSTSLWAVLQHWEKQKNAPIIYTKDPKTDLYHQVVLSFMNKEVTTNRELRALTLEGLGLTDGSSALLRLVHRATQENFETFFANDQASAAQETADREQQESERLVRVAEAKEKAVAAAKQEQEAKIRAQQHQQEEQRRRDQERQRLVEQHEQARQQQLIAEERARERAREAEAKAQALAIAQAKAREESLAAAPSLPPTAFVPTRISTTPVIPHSFPTKSDQMDVDVPETIDRQTKVFAASDAPFDVSKIEFPDDFYEQTPEDLAEAMRQQKAMKARQEADQAVMKTQAMREKERLKRLARYKRCYIRVRFPDRTELQGTFVPTESTKHLMDFVRQALREPELPFYLYTTPPLTKLSETKNLRDQGFLPAAQVLFGLPAGVQATTPFLKDEFLREIQEKQAPATLHTGVYSAPTSMTFSVPSSATSSAPRGSGAQGDGDRMDTSPLNSSPAPNRHHEDPASRPAPKWFQAGLKKK